MEVTGAPEVVMRVAGEAFGVLLLLGMSYTITLSNKKRRRCTKQVLGAGVVDKTRHVREGMLPNKSVTDASHRQVVFFLFFPTSSNKMAPCFAMEGEGVEMEAGDTGDTSLCWSGFTAKVTFGAS